MIDFKSGSCIRCRFKGADCRRCLEVCSSGALTWEAGAIRWDDSRCRACLLCCADCPTGALTSTCLNYFSLIGSLQGIQNPVLACTGQPDSQGHARVPCLGALAHPEAFLVLALALQVPLQLNLTRCDSCRNRCVITRLEQVVNAVPLEIDLKLVHDSASLEYRERECSRREFFGLLRKSADAPDDSICAQLWLKPQPDNFAAKRLPAVRCLLLQLLRLRQESPQGPLEKYWHRPVLDDSSRRSQVCTALCPTGAFETVDDSAGTIKLSAEKCVGCRLCEQVVLAS